MAVRTLIIRSISNCVMRRGRLDRGPVGRSSLQSLAAGVYSLGWRLQSKQDLFCHLLVALCLFKRNRALLVRMDREISQDP